LLDTLVENLASGDGVAAGFAGIGDLEESSEKVGDGLCGSRLAIGAVAFFGDADGLDRHGDRERKQHQHDAAGRENRGAVAANEFSGAVGERRGCSENGAILEGNGEYRRPGLSRNRNGGRDPSRAPSS